MYMFISKKRLISQLRLFEKPRILIMWCGAQGVNQKIWSHPKHDWVGEENTKDGWQEKTHEQQLVEALACPCEHLSVIKFLSIHIETIEAYTLWRNGGTFWKMLDYNMKYSPITDNHTLLWERGPIRKGKHDLSPLDGIVWTWHGHS
jgi:hypothetical protein